MRRIAAVAILLPILVGCQHAPAAQAEKYSTGGDPDDSPCARVVSAIGYVGLMLNPRGQEDSQKIEDALLGRFGELRGITLQFGPRLPESLQPAVQTIKTTTAGLARADVPRPRQIALIKQYRPAADQIVADCK
ncbi:hypothetical protein [Nonomuraea sediminis]|uniref:hypothetical protein n=1 Tax=Nonomuraea sediminis TaxID=2835864 RepID=UPI001BDCC022|nr:hypothetical protein [Nonomuraea sediminis]